MAAGVGDDGMNLSPTHQFANMQQQQFKGKRAIGVAILVQGQGQGNAKHQFGCLHYVNKSIKEAENTSRAHHSDNKWTPIQKRHASW